ncbi:G8 domain-containing protein [candidate division WWE3 bacterium]|uniref:G8 domain-containing protein n=1 Tax=candidate division WWE3 bacterium TaxID=2053526 RepID=A0A955EF64_UNCKA|nr:G8 domain-containing protein [candidate division WWE3 bacterium]
MKSSFKILVLVIFAVVFTPTAFAQTHVSHVEDPFIQNLVANSFSTHTAVKSGSWSDSSVWGGTLPSQGSRVVINPGVNVLIDSKINTPLMSVRVDGTLKFKRDVETELIVDTLVVSSTGVLDMGTKEDPIKSNVSAILTINDFNNGLDTTNSNSPDYDPLKIGQGLISMGTVNMYGSAKSNFVPVTRISNNNKIFLDSAPFGWTVGDRLVITSSDVNDSEERKIKSISDNVIELDVNLSKIHSVPAHSSSAELKLHVANLTRNVIVRSSATNTVDKRGHVMFMTRYANVWFTSFKGLGRTNKAVPIDDPKIVDGTVTHIGTNPRARYPLHFHRAGIGNLPIENTPGIIAGNIVEDSPGWGFVNHGSRAAFDNNIAYNTFGAGFVTERGDEIGNFSNNIVINVSGLANEAHDNRSDNGDFGYQGDGFWFNGFNIFVNNNVVSGFTGNAYAYYGVGIDGVKGVNAGDLLVTGDYPDGFVPVGNIAIPNFKSNTAYAGNTGILLDKTHPDVLGNGKSTIDGFVGYSLKQGIYILDASGFEFTDPILIGTTNSTYGVNSTIKNGATRYNRAHIEGFDVGIMLPQTGTDSRVYDGVFKNTTNLVVTLGGKLETLALEGNILFDTTSSTNIKAVLANSELSVDSLYPTNVTLNISSLSKKYKLAWAAQQHPDFIPFPVTLINIPSELVGKSNLQLVELGKGKEQEWFDKLGFNIKVADHKDWRLVPGGFVITNDAEPLEKTDNIALVPTLPTYVEAPLNGFGLTKTLGYFDDSNTVLPAVGLLWDARNGQFALGSRFVPENILTVDGNAWFNNNITVSGDLKFNSAARAVMPAGSAINPSLTFENALGTGFFNETGNNRLGLGVSVGGKETVRFFYNGNVGIGVAEPASRLHVKGGAVRIETDRTDTATLLGLKTPKQSWEISSTPNGELDLGTSVTASLFRFSPNGNASFMNGKVGIGTNSPNSSLEVERGNLGLDRTRLRFYNDTIEQAVIYSDAAKSNELVFEAGGPSPKEVMRLSRNNGLVVPNLSVTQSSGVAKLAPNTSKVTITTNVLANNSDALVFLTPVNYLGNVTYKITGATTLEITISKRVSTETLVNWWVIN